MATVIYNRLAQDMPLGIDATSKYLAEMEGGEADYESTSPYNTRTQPGLPPTPIASPGEYALDAALHPAEGRRDVPGVPRRQAAVQREGPRLWLMRPGRSR